MIFIENSCLKDIESFFTVFALIAGGGFFIWKILAGWLIANLDVSIEVIRQPKDKSTDWIAIKLLLKKGNIDSIHLRDISLRICDMEGIQIGDAIKVNDFQSLKIENKKIDWNSKDYKVRSYSISPGETFQFGEIAIVPFEKAVILEAAILGHRILWYRGGPQWRTSLACLPIIDRKISNAKTVDDNKS